MDPSQYLAIRRASAKPSADGQWLEFNDGTRAPIQNPPVHLDPAAADLFHTRLAICVKCNQLDRTAGRCQHARNCIEWETAFRSGHCFVQPQKW